jgi:GntR family transcriptional repressor for pyruvate dehydrogenase complex
MADRLGALNEARLSIEPDAAALAALRSTPGQIDELRAIQTRLESAPCLDSAIECDLAFHHAIADASGNQIYRLILDSLGELGLASRRLTIGRIGKAPAIEHHAAVIEAVVARDPLAARSAMRHHILAAGVDMNLPPLEATGP